MGLKERGLECKGCTDKKEFVKLVLDNQNVVVKAMPKKHKMTWAEERREKKARVVAEQGWEAAPDVVHLTDFTWEAFRAKQEKPMMVMFYALVRALQGNEAKICRKRHTCQGSGCGGGGGLRHESDNVPEIQGEQFSDAEDLHRQQGRLEEL